MQQSTSRHPPGSAGILNAYSAFPVSALCFRLFACSPLPVVAKHEVFGVLPCKDGQEVPGIQPQSRALALAAPRCAVGSSASGRVWGHAGDAGSSGEQRLARGWQLPAWGAPGLSSGAGRATEVSAKSSPPIPASLGSVGLHRGQETPQGSPLAVPAGWGSQDRTGGCWDLCPSLCSVLSTRTPNRAMTAAGLGGMGSGAAWIPCRELMSTTSAFNLNGFEFCGFSSPFILIK